jgi:type I restriction enzyme R subunit
MYLKELENDINENGEDEGSLNGLIIDKEDINKKYIKYVKELKDMICTDNLEKFSKQLTYFNKEALFKIRHYINGIRECHTEFLLSNAIKYAKQIDIEHYKKLSKALQERIDFINLGTSTVSMMEIISNEEIVKIMYEFMKTKITIMDLSKYSTDDPNIKDVVGLITKIQNGIKKNKNKSNIKIINLDELLQKIFNDLSISDLDNLDDIKCELIKVLDELNKINAEEERLSTIYGGNYAFVKVYSDCLENHTEFDKSDIETMTLLIYDKIKEVIDKETLIVQGRQNFIDNVKKQTTKELLLSKLYKKLNLKEWYDQFLSELYINLQLYK